MKIVIIHYRFYEASGPERYMFNITKLLQDKGHEIIPFSLDFKENRSSEYSKYFAKPIVEHFHVDKVKSSLSFLDKIGIIKNSFSIKTSSSSAVRRNRCPSSWVPWAIPTSLRA